MPEIQISEELELRHRHLLPELFLCRGGNDGGTPSLQTKKTGVRYPDGHVTSYRSEIRPAGWLKETIWLGSFPSEDGAMRAYDAASHCIGKVPVHYAYPPGYHEPVVCQLKDQEMVPADQEMVLEYVKSLSPPSLESFKKTVREKKSFGTLDVEPEEKMFVEAYNKMAEEKADFKGMVKEKAQCASKRRDVLQLVKDVVDAVLSDLPAAMDLMPPIGEEIEVPSEDVGGRRVLVSGTERVSGDESSMLPLLRQLPGICLA